MSAIVLASLPEFCFDGTVASGSRKSSTAARNSKFKIQKFFTTKVSSFFLWVLYLRPRQLVQRKHLLAAIASFDQLENIGDSKKK